MGRMMRGLAAVVVALGWVLLASPGQGRAEEIGSVDTVFKLLGPNHKISIEAFDDPLVPGVACHVARAR